MGVISASALTALLDSLASSKLIFDIGLGPTGVEANSVSKAAANDLATLSAIADNDVQADLLQIYRARAQGVLAPNLYATIGGFLLWWAIDKHVAGLDGFLRTNNVRVSAAVKALGLPLSPEQILPPQVDPMATFAVTGSGTGTYAHVADIDTTQYGRAWLEAVVTNAIGINTITATVNGLQFDGQTPVSKQVTIAANSSVATAVSIGTLGVQADSFDSITSVAISGGTSGDGFKVRSRVERVISATS